MPRRPEIDKPVPLYLMLPTSWRARLDLHLFSELEGRVPHGAYRNFFVARLIEFFATKELDLAPYIPGVLPGSMTVRGTPEAIEKLKRRLSLVP